MWVETKSGTLLNMSHVGQMAVVEGRVAPPHTHSVVARVHPPAGDGARSGDLTLHEGSEEECSSYFSNLRALLEQRGILVVVSPGPTEADQKPGVKVIMAETGDGNPPHKFELPDPGLDQFR